MNFYLMTQRNDPGDVLAWLNLTLRQIEAEHGIAIIISHVPPGSDDMLYEWAVRYQALMDRFQHIVRFSVFGHMHIEQHGLTNALLSRKPVGVHYWTGCVSTWGGINPSFRMFEVDAQTMLPVKVHTYVLNMERQNAEELPYWAWDHEMTQYYGMRDLSPASFMELSDRMLEKEELALRFLRTTSNNGPKNRKDGCDRKCRKQI